MIRRLRDPVGQRLHTDFQAGRWSEDLLQVAYKNLVTRPTPSRWLSYVAIRHSLCGFDAATLTELSELALRQRLSSSTPVQLRLMALQLEYGNDIDCALLARTIRSNGFIELLRYPRLLAALPGTSLPFQVQRRYHALALSLVQRLAPAGRIPFGDPKHDRLAIVGNAPNGLYTGLGEDIDSCDTVIRFNQVVITAASQNDYGSKTDLTVVSPGFTPGPQALHSECVALAGCSPFDRPGRYWMRFARLPVTEFFTFEPHCWYALVSELQAPPSAGLLTLWHLRHWPRSRVLVTGLTRVTDPPAANHYGDAVQRSSRHNWTREAMLVSAWLEDHAARLKSS